MLEKLEDKFEKLKLFDEDFGLTTAKFYVIYPPKKVRSPNQALDTGKELSEL